MVTEGTLAHAVASGLIHDNLSFASILKGAVLGGIGGAATFGVGQAAFSAANDAAASSVLSEGGTINAATNTPLGTSGANGYVLNPQAVSGLDPAQIAKISADANLLYHSTRVIGNILQAGTMSVLGGGKFEDGVFASLGSQVGGAFGGTVSEALASNLNLDPRAAQYLGRVLGAGVSAQIITARGGNGDLAFLNAVVSSTVDLAAPRPTGTAPRAPATPNAADVPGASATPATPANATNPSADDFVAALPPSAADNPSGQVVVTASRRNNGTAQSSAFEDSQDYAPDDGDQAPRIPFRAGVDASVRTRNIDDFLSRIISPPDPNPASYDTRFNYVRASGVAGNVPVGALQRALDLEMMDASITPNVGTSLGRGVPYRDNDGNVFYKTYGPDGRFVGLREVASEQQSSIARAAAAVAPIAVTGLRISPQAAALATLGVAGAIWLTNQPRTFRFSSEDDTPGYVTDRTSDPALPRRNPGYAEGALPLVTQPAINVPAPPELQTVIYVALTDEERYRIFAPSITPISEALDGWKTIFPMADPLELQGLLIISASHQPSETEATEGPIAGGGARLENLSPADVARIQNAADKIGIPITVVGSRTIGISANPLQDFDYLLPEGSTKSDIKKIVSSLPAGFRGIGDRRNLDITIVEVDLTKPHIIFNPTRKKP